MLALGAGPSFFEAEPQQPQYLVIPRRFANLLRGETYGVEASVDWRPTHFWRVKGGYSFFKMQLHRGPSGLADEKSEGRDPENQFQFHSNLTLPRNLTASDLALTLEMMGREGSLPNDMAADLEAEVRHVQIAITSFIRENRAESLCHV